MPRRTTPTPTPSINPKKNRKTGRFPCQCNTPLATSTKLSTNATASNRRAHLHPTNASPPRPPSKCPGSARTPPPASHPPQNSGLDPGGTAGRRNCESATPPRGGSQPAAARPTEPTSTPEPGWPTEPAVSCQPSLLTQKCRILTRWFAVGFAFEALPMNDSPNRWRAIATFTILASALSFRLPDAPTRPAPFPPRKLRPLRPAPTRQPQPTPLPAIPRTPQSGAANPAPAKPAPAPQPALVLPRGTRLQVRLNQTIDVKHAESGDRFSGVLAEPIVEGNTVAVPSGSAASGEVLVAHKRGHFKGKSVLALTLTRLEVNGASTASIPATWPGPKKARASAAQPSSAAARAWAC